MTSSLRGIACLVGSLLTGCASAPTHFYTLHAGKESSEARTTTPQRGVVITIASLPEMIDRKQLVMRLSSTRVQIAETQQWAQPLHEQITEVLVRDLRHDLGSSNVVSDPRLIAGGDALHVVLDIEALDATLGQSASIRGRWVISGGAGFMPVVDEYSSVRLIAGTDYDAAVDGWSELLAAISAKLAVSLSAASQ